MSLGESLENYLIVIFRLSNRNKIVHSVDVAADMSFSKPSVSHAVRLLKQKGLLSMETDGRLVLTDNGKELAENLYERHCFLAGFLTDLGVTPEQAELDAHRMEHDISEESFERLKDAQICVDTHEI